MGSSGALLRSTGMLTFVGCPAGELDRLLWSSCYPLAWMLMASVHWLLLPRSLTGGKRHSAILGLHVTLFLKSLCLTALYRSRINLNLWKTCSDFLFCMYHFIFCHCRKSCARELARLLHRVMSMTGWRRPEWSNMMGWWPKGGTCNKNSASYVNQISNLLRSGNLSYF